MLKAREILRLKHEVGLSLRDIGQSCGCGKTTVEEILKRAKDANIKCPIDMSDKELMSLLYPPSENRTSVPEPDMNYIFTEMKKKNVTLMLLWEEYKENHPDGIMYTQFCDRYRKFKKSNEITMHKEHKAGQEVEVDWAGDNIFYIDRETGEMKPSYIFVSVLPASDYPFIQAYADTKIANWIDAHIKAFEYYGGVPRVVIPDNTRTAVTTPDLFSPENNKSYNDMAKYYNIIIVPTRSFKPKDKGADECMVGIVSRRVIAALRNRQFFSIEEINEAVAEHLEKIIHKSFQKMEGNRLDAFMAIDKPMLQPLPSKRYEYAEWKEAKAQFNYHVEYQGYYYSVHYSYVGKQCSIRATISTIEVFIDSERIACHKRNYSRYNRYTTLPEHMPEEHKIVSGWSDERFLSWAEKIGPNTRIVIEKVLSSREYNVQSYRACMGILRYSKECSHEMMERVSSKAIEKNVCSFKYFSAILKTEQMNTTRKIEEKIIIHENIRGIDTYAGGESNVH